VIRSATLVLVALLLLTSCVAPESPGPDSGTSSNVDVDTAALRQLKQLAGVAPCPRTGSGAAAVEGGLPDITLPCLGGGRDVTLSALRGPMVINLWAQWCGPCRRELPHYQELHERASGKLQVIGLDWLDTQPGRALELAKQTGVTYPLLADPDGKTEVPLRIRGLPGVLFVDADGRVAAKEFLEIRSYAQLRDLVRDNLGIELATAG
jgi:thiol-disulfide isomerase/thioredoxin